MENRNILTRKKDINEPFHRPSYYMRPTKEESITKIEKQISNVKSVQRNFPKTTEYKLNLDKINTLEDVKEILGALNIKITVTNGIISHQGYDIDVLMKYMDTDDDINIHIDNKIELVFENEISRLVGIEFGREVYETQIEKKMEYSKKNTIIFPNTIEDISITFIQGLTENMFIKIKKYDFQNYFQIIGNEKVVNKIMKTIAQI